ncbi:MAG: ABC transporter ATP-binding protein [Candidatus Paraimprobicoccus trichonymphae]|uniref:ABC transporter ATP-binding protein n=1 Tax=Candidatus Paraimprobicoccus trichonymphae TaxID=3033793 RepID=A0AA48HWW5_9FIRM|nr:MAG: ABC transporter ATP-binding protein [Candidatus Paraimprobicoccus trichonymphae]
MLKIKNISKTFNSNKIFQDFNLTIDPEDFVIIVGGNGSGKSTLLNLISGTCSLDSGSITLDNKNISKLPEYKRASMISRVFQDPFKGTASDMLTYENLALAKRRGGKKTLNWQITEKEKEEYKNLIKSMNLNLEDRLNLKVSLFSGGQKQSISLLMATLKKPKLLLLDEHTSALDPRTAKIVLEQTERLVLENKLTTLMITHNMKDALKYGNRLIMLQNGKITLDISKEEKSEFDINDLLMKFEEM